MAVSENTKRQSLEITDESERDVTVAPVTYEITSYGADYDVEGLVRRLQRGEIFIPEFQRSYIWSLSEASRFIESLLLGLPVPGIFLARDFTSNRFLVLDGQQRLKTLLFFYDGDFDPRPDSKTRRSFALTNVQEPFDGKTYKTLDEKDRIRLDNSIIHATVVRQESPPDEDTSLYHIFERLNSQGRRLTAHEIRCAIYHGTFMEEIRRLNAYETWRRIFGPKNSRLKDEELILRFLALAFDSRNYARPMAEFLNKFASAHQNPDEPFLKDARQRFTATIEVVWDALGQNAFRKGRALNAAIFDSVTVGIARRLGGKAKPDAKKTEKAYNTLLANARYLEATSRSTADEKFVNLRLQLATEAFKQV